FPQRAHLCKLCLQVRLGKPQYPDNRSHGCISLREILTAKSGMAIYHFSVKTFSRSNGRSATAAIAYRAAEKIYCEREGRTHDYTRKTGVEHQQIFLPQDAPEHLWQREKLWNEVEQRETRKNSTVDRDVQIAFPNELNHEDRKSTRLNSSHVKISYAVF